MKKRRRHVATATENAVAAALAVAIEPSLEFLQHHDVVGYGRASGKRVITRVERFLVNGDLLPASADAALRYAIDHSIALGRGKSCLALDRVSGGSDVPADRVVDAARRFALAREHLDDGRSAMAPGHAPSVIVGWFAIDDIAITEISQRMGIADDRVAKRTLIRYLDNLAQHYVAVDKEAGRSRTPQTKSEALKRFDPPIADEL
jgi:hypothetical protein